MTHHQFLYHPAQGHEAATQTMYERLNIKHKNSLIAIGKIE